MPHIGVYDKYAVEWGYRPILDKTAEEEKPILNSWILEHAGDPMYRFGPSGSIDPSAQTEDLGDNAILASDYGIKNLKRIVPNLMEWTTEAGEDYADLEEMYGHVVSQFNRYMGHVATNVGGVYQYYKTADQEGAVYTHVDKEHQKNCINFLHDQLFETPEWLINNDIFNKIESAGQIERIRGMQARTLNRLLDFGRIQRMTENEAINGRDAYTYANMMRDLRNGIWSELRSGRTIDVFRRNLQRAYIDRLNYLMTNEQPPIPAQFRRFVRRTNVNVNQSDIRAVVRAELNTLRRSVRSAIGRTNDSMSRIHLQDVLERIDNILDPK